MNILKRTISALLAVVMVVTMLPLGALAEEIVGDGVLDVPMAAETETVETVPETTAPEAFVEETAEVVGTDAPTSGTCGENLTWTLVGGTLTISGTGEMDNYTGFDMPWYWDIYSISEIVIEDGVSSVGDYSFKNTEITDISLPNSIQRIGAYAFAECYDLHDIQLPDGLQSIGESAFYYCRELTSVVIPEGITEIKTGTFSDCVSLTDVDLPDSISVIGDYAFNNCQELTITDFPADLSVIGEYAFCGCTGLSNVYLSDVDVIGAYAFYCCSNLTHIILDGVSNIGDSAFETASYTEYVSIYSGLNTMGNSVFDSVLDVFYDGTKTQWDNISSGENSWQDEATFHFNNGYFADGIGSKDDPYQVATAEQLNAVRHDLSANYLQTTDIDLDRMEWEPIGCSPSWNDDGVVAFQGCFDGSYYTIYNMSILSISEENETVGLFGVNEGVIKNVNLSEIAINVKVPKECCFAMIGGISGINSGKISDCSVDGTIQSICNVRIKEESEYQAWVPYQYVGGIVGFGTCSACTNYADIRSSGYYEIEFSHDYNVYEECTVICGGIIGQSNTINTEIRNCVNYGNVTAQSDCYALSGGISGQHGSIHYCVNYGDISSEVTSLGVEGYQTGSILSYAGGIVSEHDADTMSHCINFGNVSARNPGNDVGCSAGGIAGYIGSDVGLAQCYNLGNIHADPLSFKLKDGTDRIDNTTNVGAIWGWVVLDSENESFADCYTINSVSVTKIMSDDFPDDDDWYGYNGNYLTAKEINLAIKDIMLSLGLPWEEYPEENTQKCGDDLYWGLDSNGTLTISGTGSMYNYASPYETEDKCAPWYSRRMDIKNVIIGEGTASIGAYAFCGVSISTIDIPVSLVDVGANAFQASAASCVYYAGNIERWFELKESFDLGVLETAPVIFNGHKLDVWAFPNTFEETKNGYFITNDDYTNLLSDLNYIDKENILYEWAVRVNPLVLLHGKTNYNLEGQGNDYIEWGGSCLGMSTWVCLNNYGVRNASEIKEGSESLIEHGLAPEVKSAINYYHHQQELPKAKLEKAGFVVKSQEKQLSIIEEFAKEANETGRPFRLGYEWSPIVEKDYEALLDYEKELDQDIKNAHSVVAYGWEEIQPKTIKVNDVEHTYNYRVLIYDCAVPSHQKDIDVYDYNLYYNDDNIWCIPGHKIVSSKFGITGIYNNGRLVQATKDSVDLNLIDYDTGKYSGNVDASNAFLIAASNAEYSVKWLGTTAKIDGIDVESNCQEIVVCLKENVTTDGIYHETNATAVLPADSEWYAVESEQPMSFVFRNDNFFTAAATAAAGSLNFGQDGTVAVETKEPTDFYLNLVANEGHYDLPWYKMEIMGSGASEIATEKTENGIIVSGDNLKDVTIIVTDDKQSQEKTISTAQQSVLIADQAEEIIICVDTDGDGNYETELGEESDIHDYPLGDVNHDTKINAKDATLILQKSVGVLKDTAKFCETCAEVSGDGKLNAKDSTLILQFSVGLRQDFPAQK